MKTGTKTPLRPFPQKSVRRALALAGATLAAMLLSACASQYRGEWQYNPATGYPAVGGPSFGH